MPAGGDEIEPGLSFFPVPSLDHPESVFEVDRRATVEGVSGQDLLPLSVPEPAISNHRIRHHKRNCSDRHREGDHTKPTQRPLLLHEHRFQSKAKTTAAAEAGG